MTHLQVDQSEFGCWVVVLGFTLFVAGILNCLLLAFKCYTDKAPQQTCHTEAATALRQQCAKSKRQLKVDLLGDSKICQEKRWMTEEVSNKSFSCAPLAACTAPLAGTAGAAHPQSAQAKEQLEAAWCQDSKTRKKSLESKREAAVELSKGAQPASQTAAAKAGAAKQQNLQEKEQPQAAQRVTNKLGQETSNHESDIANCALDRAQHTSQTAAADMAHGQCQQAQDQLKAACLESDKPCQQLSEIKQDAADDAVEEAQEASNTAAATAVEQQVQAQQKVTSTYEQSHERCQQLSGCKEDKVGGVVKEAQQESHTAAAPAAAPGAAIGQQQLRASQQHMAPQQSDKLGMPAGAESPNNSPKAQQASQMAATQQHLQYQQQPDIQRARDNQVSPDVAGWKHDDANATLTSTWAAGHTAATVQQQYVQVQQHSEAEVLRGMIPCQDIPDLSGHNANDSLRALPPVSQTVAATYHLTLPAHKQLETAGSENGEFDVEMPKLGQNIATNCLQGDHWSNPAATPATTPERLLQTQHQLTQARYNLHQQIRRFPQLKRGVSSYVFKVASPIRQTTTAQRPFLKVNKCMEAAHSRLDQAMLGLKQDATNKTPIRAQQASHTSQTAAAAREQHLQAEHQLQAVQAADDKVHHEIALLKPDTASNATEEAHGIDSNIKRHMHSNNLQLAHQEAVTMLPETQPIPKLQLQSMLSEFRLQASQLHGAVELLAQALQKHMPDEVDLAALLRTNGLLASEEMAHALYHHRLLQRLDHPGTRSFMQLCQASASMVRERLRTHLNLLVTEEMAGELKKWEQSGRQTGTSHSGLLSRHPALTSVTFFVDGRVSKDAWAAHLELALQSAGGHPAIQYVGIMYWNHSAPLLAEPQVSHETLQQLSRNFPNTRVFFIGGVISTQHLKAHGRSIFPHLHTVLKAPTLDTTHTSIPIGESNAAHQQPSAHPDAGMPNPQPQQPDVQPAPQAVPGAPHLPPDPVHQQQQPAPAGQAVNQLLPGMDAWAQALVNLNERAQGVDNMDRWAQGLRDWLLFQSQDQQSATPQQQQQRSHQVLLETLQQHSQHAKEQNGITKQQLCFNWVEIARALPAGVDLAVAELDPCSAPWADSWAAVARTAPNSVLAAYTIANRPSQFLQHRLASSSIWKSSNDACLPGNLDMAGSSNGGSSSSGQGGSSSSSECDAQVHDASGLRDSSAGPPDPMFFASTGSDLNWLDLGSYGIVTEWCSSSTQAHWQQQQAAAIRKLHNLPVHLVSLELTVVDGVMWDGAIAGISTLKNFKVDKFMVAHIAGSGTMIHPCTIRHAGITHATVSVISNNKPAWLGSQSLLSCLPALTDLCLGSIELPQQDLPALTNASTTHPISLTMIVQQMVQQVGQVKNLMVTAVALQADQTDLASLLGPALLSKVSTVTINPTRRRAKQATIPVLDMHLSWVVDNMASVVNLSLQNFKGSDAGLLQLGQVPNLYILELAGSAQITPQGVLSLLTCAPHLLHIRLGEELQHLLEVQHMPEFQNLGRPVALGRAPAHRRKEYYRE